MIEKDRTVFSVHIHDNDLLSLFISYYASWSHSGQFSYFDGWQQRRGWESRAKLEPESNQSAESYAGIYEKLGVCESRASPARS